ncbi:Terminal uridylyltransferase 4 [Desmophyllum pertusum]|uniref:Terminal uridylyltransferase 4 n=1 Tax=Desmophyllum pertusum TaxID=174260 RepID=A0A9X0CD74_9CNID|nr:Terminal uridylyltransferase 4 [Desmophyllum pertusum]
MVIVIAFSQKSVWNQKEKNIHNAGLLWYGFLRYYNGRILTLNMTWCGCRRTRKLTKFEKMWTKHVFAIEEKHVNGLESHAMTYQWSSHSGNFFDVYFLTDGYEAPTDRNCRVCGKIGHIAKDCPHNKSNRRAEQKKEDDERRFGKEPGEKFDMSQKPFNAGPSRPRSTSAPNRQGQDRNVDNSKPLVTAQPKKIPSDQEANVPSVTHLSRSQPDSQVVAVSPLKGRQSSKPEDDIAENVHESLQAEIPHTQSPVQNLQTGLNNENLVSDSHETVLDTRNAHSQSMVQAVSSPVIKMESGKINTIAPCGNFVNEQSGIRPPVLLQSSVNNGCIGDRSITAVAPTTPTTQTSSSVSIPLAQTQLSNLPSHVKPPPGFYAPDGAGQISRVSSERLPQPMAGSVPQSPPVNMPTRWYI